MTASNLWYFLLLLVFVKVSKTTELDLELRLGRSQNQVEEADTTSRNKNASDSHLYISEQQINPSIGKQDKCRKIRKIQRPKVPLLRATEQKKDDAPLTAAEIAKQKQKADSLLKRRLKSQHDKLMGKEPTETQKQSHRESMSRYRARILSDPELAAEHRKRLRESKSSTKDQAKYDPAEAARLKELRRIHNKTYRERKKIKTQQVTSKIHHQ